MTLGFEMEKARRRKGVLYVAAVDLRKAFDLVDREFLVEHLRRVGLKSGWSVCRTFMRRKSCVFTLVRRGSGRFGRTGV